MRVVFDTNVVIDAFNDDFNAAARLLDAAHNHKLIALITPAVEREYHTILHRLINDPAYKERIEDFLAAARPVKPEPVEVTIDDPEDYKILQAAVGGQADYLITTDRHLLTLGEIGEIRIVTPTEAWQIYQEEYEGESEWGDFARGIGIGH